MVNKKEIIDVTNGFSAKKIPQHGIKFGDFSSRNFNLFLQERVAPTPQEKPVSVSVPYRQGSIDMSGILGRRIYENRTISYIFYRFGVKQHESNILQTTIENLVMRETKAELHDSFEPNFYYTGKCREVLVREQYTHKRVEIEMIFDLHPLKRRKVTESKVGFDDFNFDLDVFHERMSLGEAELLTIEADTQDEAMNIFNSGKQVAPLVINDISGGRITVNNGNTLLLLPGNNVVTLHLDSGSTSARAVLDWQKELI